MTNFFQHYLKENKGDFYKFALINQPLHEPNAEDFAFIEHYSRLAGEQGKAIVFLDSKPAKGHISPKSTKRILEIYCSTLPNVILATASSTPEDSVRSFGEISFKYCNGKEQIYILACESNEEDIQRRRNIKDEYARAYPDIYVIDPQTTAWKGTHIIDRQELLSAAAAGKNLASFMPAHLTDSQVIEVQRLLYGEKS